MEFKPTLGTRPGFEGAWRRVSEGAARANSDTDPSGSGEQIKLVVGGQFVWTYARGRKLINAAGGRFSVTPEGQSEVIDYVAANDWLLSKTAAFTGKLDGDKWHHEGSIQLDSGEAPINEDWNRIK